MVVGAGGVSAYLLVMNAVRYTARVDHWQTFTLLWLPFLVGIWLGMIGEWLLPGGNLAVPLGLSALVGLAATVTAVVRVRLFGGVRVYLERAAGEMLTVIIVTGTRHQGVLDSTLAWRGIYRSKRLWRRDKELIADYVGLNEVAVLPAVLEQPGEEEFRIPLLRKHSETAVLADIQRDSIWRLTLRHTRAYGLFTRTYRVVLPAADSAPPPYQN